jgi:hypothetical protein
MIRPITRQVILEGTGEWTPCYMFGIRERGFQCSLWLEIFDLFNGRGPEKDDGQRMCFCDLERASVDLLEGE